MTTDYDYRFVMVNYEAKVLRYSNDEFESCRSKSIQFSDILGVEPLPMQQEVDDELERIRHTIHISSSWKSSRRQAQAKERAKERAGVSTCSSWNLWGSYLPRLGNNVQKCGFVIRIPAKRLEFVCTSHRQVEDWIAAIQAAMSLCKDHAMTANSSEADSEPSTQSCSKSSADSETSDDSTELIEVGDSMDLCAPSCKVPLSAIAEPGRCLKAGSSLVVRSTVEPLS